MRPLPHMQCLQDVKRDSDGYVTVDSDYKTSAAHIYALGGVTGKEMSEEGTHTY